jgi:hypothetical protein
VEKGGQLLGAASHPTEGTRPARFRRPQSRRSHCCTARACRRRLLAAPRCQRRRDSASLCHTPGGSNATCNTEEGNKNDKQAGTDAKNHPTHITRGRFPSQLCTALELQRIAGAVRRNRFRNTTARAASALCTRNTFSAKSKPIVLTSHGRLRLADLNGPPCHIDAVAGASAPSPPLKANRTSRSLAKSLTHRQGEG